MSAARPLQDDSKQRFCERFGEEQRPVRPARPAPLTEAELGALIAAVRGKGVTAVRNRGLIALLAGSGCKLGEALGLRDQDIDLERGELQICRSDGSWRRTARLLPAAAPHVEAWRLVRQRLEAIIALGQDESAAFFCTRQAGRVESSYVRRLLPRLSVEAGLGRTVNAGLLRSTFAAHVYRLGARLPEVQRLLGHGDARSTLHLVRPVLTQAPGGRDPVFRPEQWCLPGASGTLRVELTVRDRPHPDLTGEADLWQDSACELDDSVSAEANPNRAGQTVVAPVNWREL